MKKLHWPKKLVDEIQTGKSDLNSIAYDMCILAGYAGGQLWRLSRGPQWEQIARDFNRRSHHIEETIPANSKWATEKDHRFILQMWKDIYDAGFDGFTHIEFGKQILALFDFKCMDKISINRVDKHLDEEEGISNNDVYLSNMAKSFADKAWFLKRVPKDITTIVDFGGGTGDFAKFCQAKRPDLKYVIVDNNASFFD